MTRTLAKGSAQLVYRRALTIDLDKIGHWPIYSVTSNFPNPTGPALETPVLASDRNGQGLLGTRRLR